MSHVDIYLVRTKHSPDLTQDGGACHLYTVGLQGRINIVGVYGVIINNAVACSICKLPDAAEIRPVGGELYSKFLEYFQTNSSSTNLDSPLFFCKFEAVHNIGNLTDDCLATGALHDPNQEKFWEIGRELGR